MSADSLHPHFINFVN